MDKCYYTYAYLREDRTPYYIGKGKGHRAYRRDNRRIKPPKDRSRILILKKDLSEAEALKHEVYMIAVLGRKDKGTGILQNVTDGGEGTSGRTMSKENREKMSKVHKGKTISDAHKKRLSEAHKGKKLSLEHKKKVGDALRGRKYKCRNKKPTS